MRRFILSLFLLFPALFSCRQTLPVVDGEQKAQSIIFSLQQYRDDIESKTTYDPSGNGFFRWAEGDAVGIVSPEGGQLKFTIKPEDFGKQDAAFDGRGFALLPQMRYASYYPFIPDYNLNPNTVPITYKGQNQVGDNSMAHLGAHSFSVAKGVAPDAGILFFLFLNVGSPHRYRIPVLPGEFSRLSLTIPSNQYILSGTLDLSADDDNSLITIMPTETSNTFTIDLEGTSMDKQGQLRCWLMSPPVNLDGDVITMTLETVDGSAYIASLAGRDCPANTRRVFNALTAVYPARTKVNSEGGTIQIKVIKTDAENVVTPVPGQSWITDSNSITEGVVTTYTFTVAENPGAEREGTISFTEDATGLVNTVKIVQSKAGSIIGIGGWEVENHSGNAE